MLISYSEAVAKCGDLPWRNDRLKKTEKLLGVLMGPSARCKTGNGVGQCVPTGAH